MIPRPFRSVASEGSRVNPDWRRLRAVVLQSDDWGLCAWSPDDRALRALAGTPAFRTPAGLRYGGSTLERAEDVRLLAGLLAEFRGGDGFPPVWQANTVVAAPDYERLRPPGFGGDTVPLVDLPSTPSRWVRPGLFDAVSRARAEGVWWPELHGLHHLPEHAWLGALRRGDDDARRAHEQQSAVCRAVEGSGEYDPREPAASRTDRIEGAVARFERLFGRRPASLCPPDYRWDERLEADAQRLGVTIIQGLGEHARARLPRLRRRLLEWRWPHRAGARFYLPPRIAFEPVGAGERSRRLDAASVRRAARTAWSRGRPAIVSTHRVNYAHLDPAWSERGRAALRDLLAGLAADGARFLTDVELRAAVERGWSLRPIGERAALLRQYGAPREPVRFPAPAGVGGASLREGRGTGRAEVAVSGGEIEVRAGEGEYVIEWRAA